MQDQREEEGKDLLFVGIRVEHERAQGDEAAKCDSKSPYFPSQRTHYTKEILSTCSIPVDQIIVEEIQPLF